jgi:hypothetical protein
MIKVDELEAKHKNSQEKLKRVRQLEAADEAREVRSEKKRRERPVRIKQQKYTIEPQRVFTEYRSVIIPGISLIGFEIIKTLVPSVQPIERLELMQRFLQSPDINMLMMDRMSMFDTSSGYGKLLLTGFAKIFEQMVSHSRMPEPEPLRMPEQMSQPEASQQQPSESFGLDFVEGEQQADDLEEHVQVS